MALYQFRDCLTSELDSQEFIKGSILVCRDSGELYYDALTGERVPLRQTVHIVDGTDVTGTLYPEEGHLYFAAGSSQAAIYHNSTFFNINVAMVPVTLKNISIAEGSEGTPTVANIDAGISNLGKTFLYSNHVVTGILSNIAIADLDNTFIEQKKITAVAGDTDEGMHVVQVTNTSGMPWLGNVEIMVYGFCIAPGSVPDEGGDDVVIELPEVVVKPEEGDINGLPDPALGGNTNQGDDSDSSGLPDIERDGEEIDVG